MAALKNNTSLSKAYRDLCKRVWRIDRKAHYYMLNKAPLLDSFIGGPCLATAFAWVDGPQGWDYWRVLDGKLSSR